MGDQVTVSQLCENFDRKEKKQKQNINLDGDIPYSGNLWQFIDSSSESEVNFLVRHHVV